MQDNYLLRGKRLDNGDWATGYIIQAMIGVELCAWIYYNFRQLNEAQTNYDTVRVDQATVGRCTGLHAAKSYRGESEADRLIFEGDICKSDADSLWEIYWNESMGGWWIRHLTKNYSSCVAVMIPFIEIISTIYDRQEVSEQ